MDYLLDVTGTCPVRSCSPSAVRFKISPMEAKDETVGDAEGDPDDVMWGGCLRMDPGIPFIPRPGPDVERAASRRCLSRFSG
jgi:hypothetical protein